MAPKKWTTNEQEQFLEPWYEQYKEIGQTRRKQYTIFFANLFEAWFEKFPESVALFGEDGNSPLSEAQQAQLATAVEERKEKLKNRFKNYLGSTKAGRQSKASAQTVFKAVLASVVEGEKHRRNLQETEAYSKMFYEARLKDAIAQKLGVTSSEMEKQDIQNIKQQTRAMYAQEPEEVKQQVRTFIKTAKDEKGKGSQVCESTTDRIDFARNLEMLSAVVNQFLVGLNKSTGWAFSLLAGGPAPDVQDNIDCHSFHVGLTNLGNDFSRAYPDYEGNIMAPFRDFLYRVYPSAMRGQKGDETGAPALFRFSPQAEDNGLAPSEPVASTSTYLSGRESEEGASMENAVPASVGLPTNDVSSGESVTVAREKERGSEALFEASEGSRSRAPTTIDGDIFPTHPSQNDAAPQAHEESNFWMSSEFDQYLRDLSENLSTDSDLPRLPPPPVSHPSSPTHSRFTTPVATTPARTRYFLGNSPSGRPPSSSPSPADSVSMVAATDDCVGLQKNTTLTPPVTSGQPSSPTTSTAANLDSNVGQNGEPDVRRSRSGRVITPATRNAIADSIGMESTQPRPGKHPRNDDISGEKVKRRRH